MVMLFVYGTLKRNEANHGCLEGSEFLGTYETREWYDLRGEPGGLPYMTPMGKKSVVGEVYEVSKEVIARLDVMEGHPDHYARTIIGVYGLADEVCAYLYQRPGGRIPAWKETDEAGALEWRGYATE